MAAVTKVAQKVKAAVVPNHSSSPSISEHNDSESPYTRELLKNIRNVTKKINAVSKTEALIAENPGQTVDQLVAAKKINADQKAQIAKKPALLQSREQLEEQLAVYRKYDADQISKFQSERSSADTESKAALAQARTEAKADAEKQVKEGLSVITKFLRLAAAMRQSGDETAKQTQACEGVLLLIYGGDDKALDAAQKLIDGSSEEVTAVDGTSSTGVSYAEVRELCNAGATFAPETTTTSTEPQVQDPTLQTAGLTEQAAPALSNGLPAELVSGETAAEPSSLPASTASLGADEWVNVGESQTLPEQDTMTSSWADDTPAPDPTDGFREVQSRGRPRGGGGRGGRGQGQGRGRGRGGRGGYGEGRGGYGEGRGRGGWRGRGDAS